MNNDLKVAYQWDLHPEGEQCDICWRDEFVRLEIYADETIHYECLVGPTLKCETTDPEEALDNAVKLYRTMLESERERFYPLLNKIAEIVREGK